MDTRRKFLKNTAASTGLIGIGILSPIMTMAEPGKEKQISTQSSSEGESQRGDISDDLIKYIKQGDLKNVEKILTVSPGLRNLRDAQDRSLTWIAMVAGHQELIELLQSGGYTPDVFDLVVTGNIKRFKEILDKDPASAITANKGGFTLMSAACEAGQGASVENLIGPGSVLDQPVQALSMATPLCIALGVRDSDIASRIAQSLLGNGVNPNQGLSDGTMPLHLSASRGHQFAVSLLLRKNANTQARNKDGELAADL